MTPADLIRQLADHLAAEVDDTARGQKAKYLLDRLDMLRRGSVDPVLLASLGRLGSAVRDVQDAMRSAQ